MRRRIPDLSVVEKFPSGRLLSHLLACMLEHDRANRPPIESVLNHPFFRSWNDNMDTVDSLYRVLHNRGKPYFTESFHHARRILQDLEVQHDWEVYKRNIPPHLTSAITYHNGREMGPPPKLIHEDGAMTEHPLPNLNMCLRWIRHFNTHAFEPESIASCYDEMKAVCIGDEAVGCFIYRHDSVYLSLIPI